MFFWVVFGGVLNICFFFKVFSGHRFVVFVSNECWLFLLLGVVGLFGSRWLGVARTGFFIVVFLAVSEGGC